MSVRASSRLVARRLLRAHVGRRADHEPGLGQLLVRAPLPALRAMPKSATSALPSSVSRMFSGLMSRWMTPCAVGVLERLRGLAGDPQRVLDRELPLAPEPVAQALALDVAAW